MIQNFVKIYTSEYITLLPSNCILIAPCLNLSEYTSIIIHDFNPFDYINPKIKILKDCVYINNDAYKYSRNVNDYSLDIEFIQLYDSVDIKYKDELINDITKTYTLNIYEYVEWDGLSLNLPIYIGDFSDIESLKEHHITTLTPVIDSTNHRYLEFATINGFRLYIPVVEMQLYGQIIEE